MPLFASVDVEADQVVSFGFKTDWLAIKSNSPEAVLAKLPIEHVQIANWASSFKIMEEGDYRNPLQAVFVSPCIHGWVFVVTRLSLPQPNQTEAFDALMNPLLQAFSEVQYFGSYRVVGYVAWAKAENGQWQRQYAEMDGEILTVLGAQTAAEKALGLVDIRLDADDDVYNAWLESWDEETPAKLAEAWSINPLQLEDMNLPPSKGWLGCIKKNG